MKRHVLCFSLIIFFTSPCLNVFSDMGNGMPLKHIDSCELDFNSDDLTDVALLVETIKGRELIVPSDLEVGPNWGELGRPNWTG